MRWGFFSAIEPTARGSMTARERPTRTRILVRPRMVWRSNPNTWSRRELTRSTEMRWALERSASLHQP